MWSFIGVFLDAILWGSEFESESTFELFRNESLWIELLLLFSCEEFVFTSEEEWDGLETSLKFLVHGALSRYSSNFFASRVWCSFGNIVFYKTWSKKKEKKKKEKFTEQVGQTYPALAVWAGKEDA